MPLRQAANKMSYFNKDAFATDDALKIGRLHCFKDDWLEANQSFIKSGGFSVSALVPTLTQVRFPHTTHTHSLSSLLFRSETLVNRGSSIKGPT